MTAALIAILRAGIAVLEHINRRWWLREIVRTALAMTCAAVCYLLAVIVTGGWR